MSTAALCCSAPSTYVLSSVLYGPCCVVCISHGAFPSIVTCPVLEIRLPGTQGPSTTHSPPGHLGTLTHSHTHTRTHTYTACCGDCCIHLLTRQPQQLPLPLPCAQPYSASQLRHPVTLPPWASPSLGPAFERKRVDRTSSVVQCEEQPHEQHQASGIHTKQSHCQALKRNFVSQSMLVTFPAASTPIATTRTACVQATHTRRKPPISFSTRTLSL